MDEVKLNFKSHFNLSDIQLEEYFSGKDITIKCNINQIDALTLVAEIEELGGVCYFVPVEKELKLPEEIIIDRRSRLERRIRDRRAAYRSDLTTDKRQRQRRKS